MIAKKKYFYSALVSLLIIAALAYTFYGNSQSYLNGIYKKEVQGEVYTTTHQHKVDRILDIAQTDARIKNIILLIGDGMGVSHVFAGFSANNDQLYIQYAKHIGFQKTKSKNKYKTDSAAAGTALACGKKTNNGSLGMDENNQPLESILSIAATHGKATGLVAACKITHATPAAFIAHVPSRGQYEDIAEFFVNSYLDVMIGGGLDNFNKREDEKNLLPALEQEGFQIAYSMDEMDKIQSGKVAGLYTGGHIAKYPERGEFLPRSTEKALEILSQDTNGFFLMVEGSQIDWAGHDNSVAYVVEEMLDFDRSVGKALKFAEKDGHTLVIITADHETGGMSVHQAEPEKGEVEGRFTTESHSSLMVPVFAYGPGAEKFIGIYENTAVFDKMMTAFGFSNNTK